MKIRLLIMMVIITVAFPPLMGCDSGQSGYRTHIERNELCSFSFEYSTYYEKPIVHRGLEYTHPFVAVDILAPPKELKLLVPDSSGDNIKTVKSSYAPAYIEGSVFKPDDDSSDIHGWVDSTISNLRSWDNFEVFERSPITISEVEGEFIYYVVDWFLPVPKGEGPGLKYVREVHFYHNDLIWKLKATSELEMIDQVKADFQHILDTFQILE